MAFEPGLVLPANRAELVQAIKGSIPPARRIVVSAQYAMVLAAEGRFKESLTCTNDCLDLLAQGKRSGETPQYCRYLMLPVLYAWRQSVAAGNPKEAVLLDRAIAPLLVLATCEPGPPQRPGNAFQPDPPDLAACWLAARCIEHGLTRESRVPPGFGPLITAAFPQQPGDVPSLRASSSRIAALKALLAGMAQLPDAQRQRMLREKNEEFARLFLDNRAIKYLDGQKGILCEAALPRGHPVPVVEKDPSTLGAVLDALSQRVEEDIQRSTKCLALKSEAAQVEGRTRQIKEHTEAVGKLDPSKPARLPDLPATLDPELATKLQKSRALLAEKAQAAAAAREKLAKARLVEAATTAELRAKYEKALGPKKLLIRNATGARVTVRIAFLRDGQWQNADLRESWTVEPWATVRPMYQGRPIVCAEFKIWEDDPDVAPFPLDHILTRVLGRRDIAQSDDQAEEKVHEIRP